MTYGELVKECDPMVNKCGKCEYRMDCLALQRNGIPKPYQYHNIEKATILSKKLDDLLRQNRRA